MKRSPRQVLTAVPFHSGAIACDLHPDYLSTRLASEMSKELAIRCSDSDPSCHIASCMAENRLDEPVIGVSFDGTGLWHRRDNLGRRIPLPASGIFTRYAYLDPVALPGGDAAVKDPGEGFLISL
jgi:hydrogenase maturation protein HypF